MLALRALICEVPGLTLEARLLLVRMLAMFGTAPSAETKAELARRMAMSAKTLRSAQTELIEKGLADYRMAGPVAKRGLVEPTQGRFRQGFVVRLPEPLMMASRASTLAVLPPLKLQCLEELVFCWGGAPSPRLSPQSRLLIGVLLCLSNDEGLVERADISEISRLSGLTGNKLDHQLQRLQALRLLTWFRLQYRGGAWFRDLDLLGEIRIKFAGSQTSTMERRAVLASDEKVGCWPDMLISPASGFLKQLRARCESVSQAAALPPDLDELIQQTCFELTRRSPVETQQYLVAAGCKYASKLLAGELPDRDELSLVRTVLEEVSRERPLTGRYDEYQWVRAAIIAGYAHWLAEGARKHIRRLSEFARRRPRAIYPDFGKCGLISFMIILASESSG